MAELELEPTGAKEMGPCECCGNPSRLIWGMAWAGGVGRAAYFVHWTTGKVQDHGAHFDLILGTWGEGSSAADRVAVALEYRLLDTGPGFLVIDAPGRPLENSPLVGKALLRSEVVGTALAQEAFALADAVLLREERVAELLGR